MKVRFYCDIPNHGVRVGGLNPWYFHATTTPPPNVCSGFTRVAFDVDMPPNLVLPSHDVVAPVTVAAVTEVGEESNGS